MEKGGRLISLIRDVCFLRLRVLRGKEASRFTQFTRFTHLRFPPFSIPVFALADRRGSAPGAPAGTPPPGRPSPPPIIKYCYD